MLKALAFQGSAEVGVLEYAHATFGLRPALLQGTEPVVFILYIGNNEVVGPYGPGTVFGPFSDSRWLTRARICATRLRLAQLLQGILRRVPGGGADMDAWEGLAMFERQRIAADDPRLDGVRRQFRANIEEILALARRAGAETVLCTVAVNLRDCPPFAGDDARAVYNQARTLAASNRFDEARAAFELARDRDLLRVRADSGLNGILREIGSAGRRGIRFVDAERRFGKRAAESVPGHAVFLDHVHYNFAGNHALAAHVAEAVDGIPALRNTPRAPEWLSLSESQHRLLYTIWSELDLTDQSLQRVRRPPFKHQPDNQGRVMALMRHRAILRESIADVALDDLRPVYLDAMRAHPRDWFYPAGWASILYNSGRYEEADSHLQAALALAPHLYDLRAAHALVLGFLGRPREGITAILGADRRHGLFSARFMLSVGRTLMADNRPAEAAEFLEEAVRRDPANMPAAQSLAASHERLGDPRQAEAVLRLALERSPGHPEVAEDLALFLANRDRWEEALALFQRVRALHPNRPETRLKLALCEFRRGHPARAIQELESLRDDHPDFALGRFNLGQFHAAQGQWDSAAAELDQAIALQPDLAEAWFQLARVRHMQNDSAAQRQALSIAVRLDPDRREFIEEWDRLHPARKPAQGP